jgi:8-oxo-dGTP pyrophosphatase MutT (NUDIX family)
VIETSTNSAHLIHRPRKGHCRKAGIFLYDPEEERVLLVQSRGLLWGPPKGTLEMELRETPLQCALREVKEETGLEIKVEELKRATKIKNRATYYYAEVKSSPIHIQQETAPGEDAVENDADGITWIKLSCLEKCTQEGSIVLNQHCRILMKRFLNTTFSNADFIKVEQKRNSR